MNIYTKARPTNSGAPVLPTISSSRRVQVPARSDWMQESNGSRQLEHDLSLSFMLISGVVSFLTACVQSMSRAHGEPLQPALVSQFPLSSNSDGVMVHIAIAGSSFRPQFLHHHECDASRKSLPDVGHSVYDAEQQSLAVPTGIHPTSPGVAVVDPHAATMSPLHQ